MTQAVPSDWNTADVLEGSDYVNKATLVGEPLRLVSVTFVTNKSGILFANVEAEQTNGDIIAFNDTSQGVRAQLQTYVAERYNVEDVELDALYELNLVCPRGLRESVFGLNARDEIVREDDPKAVRKGRTFYLTSGGNRPAPNAPTESTAAKKTPAKKAPVKRIALDDVSTHVTPAKGARTSGAKAAEKASE
jgi:hypothetical protein